MVVVNILGSAITIACIYIAKSRSAFYRSVVIMDSIRRISIFDVGSTRAYVFAA